MKLDYVANGLYEDDRDEVLKTSIRVNRTEARRVAALVLHHVRTRPAESLGVVTLGMNQRDVVEEEIKQARLLDQSLDDFFLPEKPEPFFVKALEQVQGDERDVIMISIGYGKNAQGVLSHNFGPINQEGGERRLNVLVTRAKHQVILVTSIRAGDIDLTRTQKLGPRLLKNYLDFAERGSVALEAELSVGSGEYESPFEEGVGEALKRAGFAVHSQVGCSKFRIDLAIVDPRQPGRYILGIECDGKAYHQSKTARDRDRLRQEILERLGWTIHRIWSTDWIRQRDREVGRVIERVDQLLEGTEARSDVSTSRTDRLEENEYAIEILGNEHGLNSFQDPPESTIVHAAQVSAVFRPVATAYQAAELVAESDIAHTVVSCVEVEGPIHRDLLLRRVTTSLGYQRAGSRIAAQIEDAISVATRRGHIKREGEFLWPVGLRDIVPRGPAADGTVREIAHIPNEEIERGMILLLQRAFSLGEDELVAQTARIFGFQRTGSDINRRVRDVIQNARQVGLLETKGGRYQVSR